jgi:hypothetical protein
MGYKFVASFGFMFEVDGNAVGHRADVFHKNFEIWFICRAGKKSARGMEFSSCRLK